MSRKDYELIAAALAAARPDQAKWAYITWDGCVLQMCKHLMSDNPNFDEKRFINACLE